MKAKSLLGLAVLGMALLSACAEPATTPAIHASGVTPVAVPTRTARNYYYQVTLPNGPVENADYDICTASGGNLYVMIVKCANIGDDAGDEYAVMATKLVKVNGTIQN